MDMVIVKRNSAEWEYMWNWLSKHPINEGIENPTLAWNSEYAEGWQYMGSYKKDDNIIHEFRHRVHPRTKDRMYLKLNASENMNPDDIENTIPIK
jgi:hypothetical protein